MRFGTHSRRLGYLILRGESALQCIERRDVLARHLLLLSIQRSIGTLHVLIITRAEFREGRRHLFAVHLERFAFGSHSLSFRLHRGQAKGSAATCFSSRSSAAA
jgi:hypothetical protein